MSDQGEENEGVAQREFWSQIVSGESHEIISALTAISELVGLQDDVLRYESADPDASLEKLRDITFRLQRKISQAVALVQSLNQFAHSVDPPISAIDLRANLVQLEALAQRLLSLAGATLTLTLPEHPVRLHAHPYDVMQAIFLMITRALSTSPDKCRLNLKCSVRQGMAVISVSALNESPQCPRSAEANAQLARLAGRFGASVVGSADGHDASVPVLQIPLAPTDDGCDDNCEAARER